MSEFRVPNSDSGGHGVQGALRSPPRSGVPAAHGRVCLALLPSGPDAVRSLALHRLRTAVHSAKPSSSDPIRTLQPAARVYYTGTRVASSRYFASASPTTTVKKST